MTTADASILRPTNKSPTSLRARVFDATIWVLVLLAIIPFAWTIADLLIRGLPGLDLAFLTGEPSRAGRAGGIAPVIVSTVIVLLICILTAGPLGLATGILLAEYSRTSPRALRWVQLSLDTLAGVPSVVFGLFGNAIFSTFFGLGYSLLSGGLTLACMILPFLVRSVEQSLAAIPGSIRQAAHALALSRKTVLFKLLLPAALPALASGLMLGIGRSAGETAALLFTSGYALRMPDSLVDGGRVLSVHIFDLSLNISGATANAYKSAVVLLLLLVAINAVVVTLQSRHMRRTAGRY